MRPPCYHQGGYVETRKLGPTKYDCKTEVVTSDLKIKTGSSILLFLDSDAEANCVWPPNMAAEDILMPVFFVKNRYTIIQSRAEHS